MGQGEGEAIGGWGVERKGCSDVLAGLQEALRQWLWFGMTGSEGSHGRALETGDQ